MAPNLKGRLARIRKLGLVKAAELGEAADPGRAGRSRASGAARGTASFLGGWDKIGELAWARTLRYSLGLPESLDPTVFAPLKRLRAMGGASERVLIDRFRFFDLETTGLSGGTGTVAFLAAVGRAVDGEFELTQLFLEDYPGEGAFIEHLVSLLQGDACIVSYNGRAFDLPLLRTRCVMNGIVPPEPEMHIDALFASRRLWKRVHGGASLGLLERQVLGVERGEDLPGAMIPEVWLSFAREGDHPLMRLVLSHNAEDVVGLARLTARAQAIFDDPRARSCASDLDLYGLGRTLLLAGRVEEGEELLEAAAGEGDEAAGLLLSLRYRRERRAEDCLRVSEMLPGTYRCAIERAKLHERLSGDLSAAARWAKEALRLAQKDADREAAIARLARIEQKLG